MKKIIFSILLVLLFSLTSCSKEDVEVPLETIECSLNQVELDNVCVDLTGTEIQLRNAIDGTKDLTNYSLKAHVVSGDLDYTIDTKIDENMSMMIYDYEARTEFFRKNIDGTCEYVELYLDTTTSNTIACSIIEDKAFFMNFDYSWFELNAGKFHIKEEYKINIKDDFKFNIENINIIDVTVATSSNIISDISISFIVNDDEYLITMEIRDINQVEIEWGVGVTE